MRSRATRAPWPNPARRETADEARRAIAEHVRTPASIENAEQLARLLVQLGPEAIPAIPPAILNPSELLDGPRALLLIQFWIDRDPKGAAEWAAKNAPPAYKLLTLEPAVERLAESDPQAALRFVGVGPAGRTRTC